MNQGTQDGPDSTRFDRLSPAEMVKLNRLCDQFESSWQQTQPTLLTDFLAPLSAVEREAALPELVLIDLHYRQRTSLVESAQWYLERFPSLNRQWLDQQIALQKAEPLALSERQADSFPWHLGDYLIRGPLGSGGMGQVYRAEHKLMGRTVAIKVLKENRLTDLASRQRFEREVRTLARLSHPNIVTAFDAREDQGVLYLVTELVEGEDLAERVKRKGPLPPLEAMHFIWQAAKGLHYAHSQGIVHRDIKPSNLLLNRKKVVKVLDLGLARLQASDAGVKANDPTLTHAGHFVGTVAFMAPEQARSAVLADERSDIYGLGCTLYYTLTGKVPFRGETDLDTILAHLEQPIPNLPQASGRERIPFPIGLSALLQHMLAKSPVDRPPSMQAVVDELSSLIKQEQRRAEQGFDEIHAVSTPRPNSETGSPQRRKQNFQALLQAKTFWIAMATCLLLALIVVRQFWPFNNPSRNDPSFLENLGRAATSQEAQGNLPPPADSNSNQIQAVPGIRFDGRNDYLAVDHFDLPLPSQIRVEMAVIVDEPQGPANLLTWSGPRSFVFFVSERRWGVAYFDGHQPQLMVSSQNIRPGQLQLVAGEWDGQQLRIFVDGQPVAIQEIQYALHPSSIGLYLGGVPDGILPAEQGTRYFGGSLTAVRISNDTKSRPAQSIAELHTVSPSSVALFRFTEGAGETTSDQSQHRWQARFHGAAWNR